MTKEIIETTREREDEKGLYTKLFFDERINIQNNKFHQIDVSSKKIKVKDKEVYETMTFGVLGKNKDVIIDSYVTRTTCEDEMISNHWVMVSEIKNVYFNQ